MTPQARLAHDLNNLLNVIVGYGELMRRQVPADHPARARLEHILSAADRATGLTRQLLELVNPAEPMPLPAREEDPRLATGTLATIVVAEDAEALREAIREILEARGFQVRVAADADQAVALFADPARPVDLLLTDVVMPKVGGPELARRVAKIAPRAKVLYMSGSGEGATALDRPLLAKPFTGEALVRAVRQALEAESGDTPDGE
jgi:hypothetical protein